MIGDLALFYDLFTLPFEFGRQQREFYPQISALIVKFFKVKEKTLANAGEVLYKKIRMWRPPKPTEAPTIEPTTTGEEGEEVNAEDGEEVKSDDKPAEEATTEKPAEDTTHDGSEL